MTKLNSIELLKRIGSILDEIGKVTCGLYLKGENQPLETLIREITEQEATRRRPGR